MTHTYAQLYTVHSDDDNFCNTYLTRTFLKLDDTPLISKKYAGETYLSMIRDGKSTIIGYLSKRSFCKCKETEKGMRRERSGRVTSRIPLSGCERGSGKAWNASAKERSHVLSLAALTHIWSQWKWTSYALSWWTADICLACFAWHADFLQALVVFFFFWAGELFITHTCNERNHKCQMDSRSQPKLQATVTTHKDADTEACKMSACQASQAHVSCSPTQSLACPLSLSKGQTMFRSTQQRHINVWLLGTKNTSRLQDPK